MNIHLTPDQRTFISEGIAAGRFRTEDDAIQEALALWEERERRRLEILATLDQAEASLAEGRGLTIASQEESRQLAANVKQRGLARLQAEQAARR